MKLIINGEEENLDVHSLLEIIQHYELEHHLVVLEVNGQIIDRKLWETTKVEPGTKIEIVHFVGGG